MTTYPPKEQLFVMVGDYTVFNVKSVRYSEDGRTMDFFMCDGDEQIISKTKHIAHYRGCTGMGPCWTGIGYTICLSQFAPDWWSIPRMVERCVTALRLGQAQSTDENYKNSYRLRMRHTIDEVHMTRSKSYKTSVLLAFDMNEDLVMNAIFAGIRKGGMLKIFDTPIKLKPTFLKRKLSWVNDEYGIIVGSNKIKLTDFTNLPKYSD
jgi:hypothetical protein